MKAWQIGAVSYLNSKPLIYELERSAPQCSVSYDLPSRLAHQLHAAQLDVALVPSIESLRQADYLHISDACIACRGPVWSVKLLSRTDPQQIRTLALDEGSLTSVVLIQILLKHHFDISPSLRSLAIDTRWQDETSDAVLIIGDRAMNPGSDHPFGLQIDLGQWWHDWTGLPFVFALWMARRPSSPRDVEPLSEVLSQVRDRGVSHLREIAEMEASHYGLTPSQCLDYFQNYLHFQLGDQEMQGLTLFQDLARKMDLDLPQVQLQYDA